MKQRLAIALAIMHDPELLILDEPINGLDPIGIAEVRSFIRDLCNERGKTILISSHILSEIALLADDIGIIDHGALLEEESLAELEAKSSKHIRFVVSDTAQAARILERIFHESQFTSWQSARESSPAHRGPRRVHRLRVLRRRILLRRRRLRYKK